MLTQYMENARINQVYPDWLLPLLRNPITRWEAFLFKHDFENELVQDRFRLNMIIYLFDLCNSSSRFPSMQPRLTTLPQQMLRMVDRNILIRSFIRLSLKGEANSQKRIRFDQATLIDFRNYVFSRKARLLTHLQRSDDLAKAALDYVKIGYTGTVLMMNYCRISEFTMYFPIYTTIYVYTDCPVKKTSWFIVHNFSLAFARNKFSLIRKREV